MTVKEKLQFFADNGMSITFIAKQMGVSPSTLTKWLHNEKGITHKNEDILNTTLQNITKKFMNIMEVSYELE